MLPMHFINRLRQRMQRFLGDLPFVSHAEVVNEFVRGFEVLETTVPHHVGLARKHPEIPDQDVLHRG